MEHIEEEYAVNYIDPIHNDEKNNLSIPLTMYKYLKGLCKHFHYKQEVYYIKIYLFFAWVILVLDNEGFHPTICRVSMFG